MKYWYDCEFMEDGITIELLSIGVVAEDVREFYAVNEDADLLKANDWVKENVLSKLAREWGGFRRSFPIEVIRDALTCFMSPTLHGKPEFWGYYSAYDHVVLCQLFGKMVDLPEGWPMYTNDIKQLCYSLGDPKLPDEGKDEHNALFDARWNKKAYEFLIEYARSKT